MTERIECQPDLVNSLSAIEERFTKFLKILCLEVVLENSVLFSLVYANECSCKKSVTFMGMQILTMS